MMSRGRTLLKEVLGEDQYQDYEAGQGITIQSPDGYVYRMHKGNHSIHISRRIGNRVSAGDITGSDLYDSAASFVTAAKLGKVNWGCGSIRVELPSNMPPTKISFVNFISRGISIFFRTMLRLPRQIYHGLITLNANDDIMMLFPFLVIFGFLLFIVVDMFLPQPIKSIIYLGTAIFGLWIWYLRWKRKWGGETT